MNERNDMEERVKRANRSFYDLAADVYEQVDGRRSDEVNEWISDTLRALGKITSGGVLLDFGCGSGVVMGASKGIFDRVYGIDISPEILKIAREKGDGVICADASALPLKDNSVDVVVCFAVLHHIYDHWPLIKEIYRVLKKGGILYTDHDMDKAFSNRFKLPLMVYRAIFNASRKYRKAKGEITEEMYELTEIHADGIDSAGLLEAMKGVGFLDIECHYHWFGLSRMFNVIMKKRKFNRGSAPIVGMLARK